MLNISLSIEEQPKQPTVSSDEQIVQAAINNAEKVIRDLLAIVSLKGNSAQGADVAQAWQLISDLKDEGGDE
jgi:hypothetical protein